MSSAADDSPEMSRLKMSEKKKNKYKLSFFNLFLFIYLFFFSAVVNGALRVNLC